MSITWLVMFPILMGFINFCIGVWQGLNDIPTYNCEKLAIMWFILAVLMYGVFK